MPRRKEAEPSTDRESSEISQDESNQDLELDEIHQHLKNSLDKMWIAAMEQSDAFSNGLNEYRASLKQIVESCSEYHKLMGQLQHFVWNIEEQCEQFNEKVHAVEPLASNLSRAIEHIDNHFEQIISIIGSDDRVQEQIVEGSRVQKDLEMYLETQERSSHDRKLMDKMAALIKQRQASRME